MPENHKHSHGHMDNQIHDQNVHGKDEHLSADKENYGRTESNEKQMHTGMHEHRNHHDNMILDFKKRFWISLIITVPIVLLSPMIHELLGFGDALQFRGDMYLLFVLSSAVYFYGGQPFLRGLLTEMKKFRPGMMTLIALAISTAYFYSSAVVFGIKGEIFFWELATLIDIMLLGHWIEMKSVLSASAAMEELVKLLPDEAHKINGEGIVTDIPVAELNVHDKLLIKPGEKIPADGKIFEGESSINESMITGESVPVYKKRGEEVIGGSINGEGSIKIFVEKTGEDTFLSKVVKMVKEAQESKSRTQNLADRAAFWLTIIAVAAGGATMFIWLAVAGESFNFALTRAVTVMIITCPHALGLAIPLVVAVSTTLTAKNGLLIRNRTAFEQARKIQAVIFDKTGTLTKGEFGVTDVISFLNDFNEKEILSYAAAVESESEHPIAQGILKSAEMKYKTEFFNSLPGKGAMGKVNGKDVKVVSPGYLEENKIEFADVNMRSSSSLSSSLSIKKLSGQGKTVVFLLINNTLAGAIALADVIREESKEAIMQLKEMGIKPMMLTGDNKQVAEWVAGQLKIEDYFAEVLPDKKAGKVKEVQKRKFTVAMIGDGVNDAPALAQADVGIAIGAGTDVAVETSDIILVKNNPKDVVKVIKFARAAYRKMVQNLLWAAGYNIFAIPLAAGVLYSAGILLSPALGAVLMSVSTVVVALNAKLLKI